MKMNMFSEKIKLFTVLSFVVALMITGCFEDRESLFEEKVLEWEPPNPANNLLNTTVELDAGATENEIVTLRIRYAGEHQSEPITGVFAVETDAVEGTHYTISSTSTTIPANSSFSDEVNIEVLSEAIEDGETFDIILTITDESDLPPMENYKTFVLSVEKDAE